jgi:transcriptional regulator with XRE-family HTH domain
MSTCLLQSVMIYAKLLLLVTYVKKGVSVMNKLALWRAKRGMTIRELANKSSITTSTISQIEKGHRKAYLSTIGKLATALEIEIEELVDLVETNTGREDKNPKRNRAA